MTGCFRSLCRVVGLLAVSAVGYGAPAGRHVPYGELVSRLTDLDRLTRLQSVVRSGQFASWDRRELEQWGTNGDAGHYLRVEPDGEAVLMEQDGPGCIYRIWSANPMGTLRIYLDGAAEPSWEGPFASLFTGDTFPFIRPLVYKRSADEMAASDCYVPIPFAKSIRVTQERTYPQFYIINYLRLPDDETVDSFRLPLSEADAAAVRRAAAVWEPDGADPKPRLPGQTTIRGSVTVLPGATVSLCREAGPGQIRAIRVRAASAQRYFWRKLVLRGVWDDAAWPQVLAPLGPLFGFDWETAEYASLPAGCLDGQAYLYFPMPFRRSGELSVTSYLEQPAMIEYEIERAPMTEVPDDLCTFYARWRREPDCTTFDYPFIETAGRGHLVGVSLQVDHPVPGWWGEGDEKVWVDDDRFPPWVGTGSEDYFGDAWGIRYLPGASWGCSYDANMRTAPYRWHLGDLIPFRERLRMTIENYGNFGGGRREEQENEYASVAYWYQAETIPPLARLEGQTYIGGTVEGQAPSEQRYRTDIFREITGADLITTGRNVAPTLEAENDPPAGVAIVTDAALPYEFSMERALVWAEATRGQTLRELPFEATKAGVVFPVLHTGMEEGLVPVEMLADGTPLAPSGPDRPGQRPYSGVFLDRGPHVLTLKAGANGRAVIDAVELRGARAWEDVLEAEILPAARVSAGSPRPAPGPALGDASAGGYLDWHPAEMGAEMDLPVPGKPGRTYALGVRPVRGPDRGIVQLWRNGEPAGPEIDLYAAAESVTPLIERLGALPPEAETVTLRLVGRNPQASGTRLSLDFFRQEPLLEHPETTPGVRIDVAGTQGCGYRIQDIGGAVYGHHLWVNPSGLGAYVELVITVPEAGSYDVSAGYTTSWDYATVQAVIDGQPAGEPVDCYTPEVRQSPEIQLGRFEWAAGGHTFRLQAAGKHPKSVPSYLMGLDYLKVRRAARP